MSDVYDAHMRPLKVGDRVHPAGAGAGTVTAITDPDGDMDDEGRPVAIDPAVYVTWDGCADPERFSTSSLGTPWDQHAGYRCDDLELAAAGDTLYDDEKRDPYAEAWGLDRDEP